MELKNKIRIAVIVVVAGALAALLLSGDDQGSLRITFTGLSATDSNRVVFAIVNRFGSSFSYGVAAEERLPEAWNPITLRDWERPSPQIGQNVERHEFNVPSTNQWRLHLVYLEPVPSTPTARARIKLSEFLEKRLSAGLGRALRPREHWKHSDGPLMLGNQLSP